VSAPLKKRRAKPGAKGGGRFYHVMVRPKGGFVRFRVQDVGAGGGIERLAGQRPSGSWATVTWLVAKDQAHTENGLLLADSSAAKKLFGLLGSQPVQVTGDRFRAKDRPNVPEAAKPTSAQKRARSRNINKAQAAKAQARKAAISNARTGKTNAARTA